MIALFVDSSVFLHALGAPRASTDATRHVVDLAVRGAARLHTSAECIQEIAFHRMRVGRREVAVDQTSEVRNLCVVHPLDDSALDRGLDLIEHHGARGRDAFIAATALLAGFDSIVTTDASFVDVPGLRRIDPRDITL